jgi:hypothetical protein
MIEPTQADGAVPKPSREDIQQWVHETWEAMPEEIISGTQSPDHLVLLGLALLGKFDVRSARFELEMPVAQTNTKLAHFEVPADNLVLEVLDG